jgi:hypothetical protein
VTKKVVGVFVRFSCAIKPPRKGNNKIKQPKLSTNFDLLLENITNPALLFFLLGIIAVRLKVI